MFSDEDAIRLAGILQRQILYRIENDREWKERILRRTESRAKRERIPRSNKSAWSAIFYEEAHRSCLGECLENMADQGALMRVGVEPKTGEIIYRANPDYANEDI